jgi:hypothetical protein
MSRTTLCLVTAAVLAGLSVSLMVCRRHVLGSEVKVANRPGTWKVTMLVRGRAAANDSRLLTTAPVDFGRQHIQGETLRSAALSGKPLDSRHPERRQMLWTLRPGLSPCPIQATYEFYAIVDVRRPTAAMTELAKKLAGPPRAGEYLDVDLKAGDAGERITRLGRELTEGVKSPADQVEALFRFVDGKIQNEPSVGAPPVTAAECLEQAGGDAGGKSRLLTALLRSRGIPARMVTGLPLTKGPKQQAHYWVEAWVQERWLPLCPFFHHFGRVPATYLVFGYGDLPLVRGRHCKDLDYAFLIERRSPEQPPADAEPSPARRLLLALSFQGLPPTEQRLVEFLLLLPVAALLVCVFRNVIGLYSFGTFAPALVGLAFRDLQSLPGLVVFVAIVLVGWGMRRVLDHYHLLQVPRKAFLLSLVVVVLIAGIVFTSRHATPLAPTQYIALFPLVILTSMIERFWTLETEDSTSSSFRTLLGTMLIAAAVGLLVGLHAVVHHLVRYPETLGLVMAGQLLLGRYTGYKLSEFFRFQDFLNKPAVDSPWA